MPSIRKRIGYLPSQNIQEIITQIANKEKLSQSKVVGVLVEEALIARGVIELKNRNNLISKKSYYNANHIDNLLLKDNDLDELISDKGITYNKKNNYRCTSDYSITDSTLANNKELFEQFKQFILFQKMLKER